MLKKVISALLVSGIVAILTPQVTEANICPAGTFHYCTKSGGISTCRCYSTSSVRCDIEYEGGIGPATLFCDLEIAQGSDILVICANNALNVPPGLQTVPAPFDTIVSASGPATPGKKEKNNVSAMITVDLLSDGELKEALDAACVEANNQHYSAVAAVPCDSTNTVTAVTGGGNTLSAMDTCTLQVQECDPQFAKMPFNKKTGKFGAVGYFCGPGGTNPHD